MFGGKGDKSMPPHPGAVTLVTVPRERNVCETCRAEWQLVTAPHVILGMAAMKQVTGVWAFAIAKSM